MIALVLLVIFYLGGGIPFLFEILFKILSGISRVITGVGDAVIHKMEDQQPKHDQ